MKGFITLKSFTTLTVLILTIFSCKKDEQYRSNAEIIGYDAKTCPCCGGTEIIIDNVQNTNGNAYFLVDKFPSNFTIGDNPKFPIAVKVDWKIDTLHCFRNYLDITRIERR
jgi:hypothetical protein